MPAASPLQLQPKQSALSHFFARASPSPIAAHSSMAVSAVLPHHGFVLRECWKGEARSLEKCEKSDAAGWSEGGAALI